MTRFGDYYMIQSEKQSAINNYHVGMIMILLIFSTEDGFWRFTTL